MTMLRWLLRGAGALLLIAIAVVHAKLWFDGYRTISVIGPMFALNAVLAVLLAFAVVLAPLRYLALVALAGAALAAGTAAGLLLTTRITVFGFTESLHAQYAVLSLALEGAATVVLLVLAWVSFRRLQTPRSRSAAIPRARTPH